MHRTDECSGRVEGGSDPCPFLRIHSKHPLKSGKPEGVVEWRDAARDVLHVTTVLC